jgi:hypothetical protein
VNWPHNARKNVLLRVCSDHSDRKCPTVGEGDLTSALVKHVQAAVHDVVEAQLVALGQETLQEQQFILFMVWSCIGDGASEWAIPS